MRDPVEYDVLTTERDALAERVRTLETAARGVNLHVHASALRSTKDEARVPWAYIDLLAVALNPPEGEPK